jgi:hypothetical protein
VSRSSWSRACFSRKSSPCSPARGDVARGVEVLRGHTVGGLGDDRRQLHRGRYLVQLRAQLAASLMNLSRPARTVSGRGEALSGVVLMERGEDAPASVFDADRFLEEVTARPLSLTGSAVRSSGAQVRDGCIQYVPLWRWKILFLWRWAFKRRARGAR